MSDIDNAVSDADMWHVQMPSGDIYTVTVDQLDDAFQRGLIDENTLVMMDGTDSWATLAEVLGGNDDGGETPTAEAPPEASFASPYAAAEASEYASDRVSAELGLAAPADDGRLLDAPDAPAGPDAMDEAFDRIVSDSPASPNEEPTQREMALARPGGTTLLNYPPPPPLSEAFSAVALPVQAAAEMGVPTPPAAPPPPVLQPTFSAENVHARPTPPPSEAAYSRPVPPPAEPQAFSRPVPPPAQPQAYSRPVPPPAQPQAYSRPVPPPAQPQAFSRPVPPPSAGSQSRPASGYPPPAFGGVYPPPTISSAPPSRVSEPPGFAGPKSTPPIAYDVGDIDVSTPRFRSRGRGVMLAVAASVALVGGAIGLSRMDGSSLVLFPQASSPVAAAAPKPYTPPPAKPAPKPEPAPEPVVAKPEPVKVESTPAQASLAEDMKKALRGGKVSAAKVKAQAKASVRPNLRRGSGKVARSSGGGALGKGGDTHDPLNGSL